MQFSKKCTLIVLTALLAASLFCHPLKVDASATDVRFDYGEWVFLEQTSSSAAVEIKDDCLTADVGTLNCPGASGILRIGIVNDGQHSVNLSLSDSVLKAESPIQIEISGDVSKVSPTVLAPGEHCFLHVTIRWNPENSDTDVNVSTCFAISLSCEGKDAVIEGDQGGSADTGVYFPTVCILLAISSLVAILMLKNFKKEINT